MKLELDTERTALYVDSGYIKDKEMHRTFMLMVALLVCAIGVQADEIDVALWYDGLTRTNRLAIRDIDAWSRERAPDLMIRFMDTPPAVADAADVLVLFSSGARGNLSSEQERWLDAHGDSPDRRPVIVVLLAPEGEPALVGEAPDVRACHSVDAVSATTAWPGNRLRAIVDSEIREQNRRIEAMHEEWFARLVALIRAAR